METATFRAGGARLVVPAPPVGYGRPGGPHGLLRRTRGDPRLARAAGASVRAKPLFGRVVSVRETPDGTWLRVDAEGIAWTVRLTRAAEKELALTPGSAVWLTIKTHAFRRLA